MPLLSDRIYTGVTYEKLFKVKNERYVTGIDPINVTVTYNLSTNGTLLWNRSFTVKIKSWKTAGTGELQVNETGNYTLCGTVPGDSVCQAFIATDPAIEPCNITLSLELKEPKLYYENGETIKFWNRMDAGDIPFSIAYWIEDLDGDLKKLTLTENTNQKRWTPRTTKEFDVFILKNEIELLACNNTNNDTSDERLIVVKGESEEPEQGSRFEMKLSEPKKGYEFGDEVKVRIIAYKGNASKYAIKAYVEDVRGKKVSSIATMYAKKKYTDYDVTLPVLLDEREGSGKHRVVVEGLDISVSEKIWIKGTAIAKQPEQIIEKPAFTIASFYTRNTKPRDEINLYASIKGNGVVTVELIGLQDHHEQELELTNSYKYTGTVHIQEGANIFLLRVKDDDNIITQRALLLEMTDEIRKVEKFSNPPPIPRPPTHTEAKEGKKEVIDERPDSNFLTANTTYDADTTTAAVPVLLGIMGALLLGVILRKR